ncbi:hypothetical protein [Arthrobacter sp. 4R501]|nr:hypothetical protein [Arthrobacter sp. 4R501]
MTPDALTREVHAVTDLLTFGTDAMFMVGWSFFLTGQIIELPMVWGGFG